MSSLSHLAPLSHTSSSRKRNRQPVSQPSFVFSPASTPHSTTVTSTPSALPPLMDPDSDCLNQRNHSPNSLWAGFSLWADQQEQDELPVRKRRRGVAGAILSTALDAAMFTSAVGYAAYQFWCGKTLEDDLDDSRNRFSVMSPPPPYEARDPRRSRPMMRRQNSSRPPPRIRAPHSTTSQPINFVLRPPPTEEEDLMSDFVCSLKPYEPPPAEPEEEDGDEGEGEDEQMRAFKAQIKALINDGQAALASRPEPPPPRTSQVALAHTAALPLPATLEAVMTKKLSTDENVRLLQSALEQAAIAPRQNWWEHLSQS